MNIIKQTDESDEVTDEEMFLSAPELFSSTKVNHTLCYVGFT